MYSAQGIILSREDFRERDERVVLYTKEFGKISVVAKGTKRIGAKLRGNLDIFNFVDIIFVEGRNFFILTGVDTLEKFPGIIKNSYIYSTALSVAGMISGIFQEMDRDERFFRILYGAISKLDDYGQSDISVRQKSLCCWLLLKKFQSAILKNQGYKVDDNVLLSLKIPKPSAGAAALLEMLSGSASSDIRLSKHDFDGIESIFGDIFLYIFNHRISSWTPVT